MKACWCRFLFAVLVIVFAWVKLGGNWNAIVLTVLGALLAILALTGVCCCKSKCEEKEGEKKE